MISKPELRNIKPQGGFRRDEIAVISAFTPASKSVSAGDFSKLEERVLAHLPKRTATIPEDVESDCLFCKTTFRTLIGACANGTNTCPCCKSYHTYGAIENGEVQVKAISGPY